jgi:hypothetical protein
VAEPQAYALPGGIALLALAYLHWRRGAAGQKLGLEIGALALLLGTSLLQALSAWDVSAGRLDYATFLLLEGVLVLGIGAVLRWKRTFFAAAAAIVAATGALLADPLQSLNTWYLMAIIGIAMITLVVLLEQRRQQIPLWIDEVRLHLEAWS